MHSGSRVNAYVKFISSPTEDRRTGWAPSSMRRALQGRGHPLRNREQVNFALRIKNWLRSFILKMLLFLFYFDME